MVFSALNLFLCLLSRILSMRKKSSRYNEVVSLQKEKSRKKDCNVYETVFTYRGPAILSIILRA